jgi:hypothetical protein
MGRTKGAYNPEFPHGTLVRVAGRRQLEEFARTWCLHNPLTEHQLGYADVASMVVHVSFYHGGDELYELEGVPGVWHEACLVPV